MSVKNFAKPVLPFFVDRLLVIPKLSGSCTLINMTKEVTAQGLLHPGC